MTFITVGVEVSCLLRFTPTTNLVAHTSQFGDGGLILCWSRIRKFVTYIQRTYRQTEKAIKEAPLIDIFCEEYSLAKIAFIYKKINLKEINFLGQKGHS